MPSQLPESSGSHERLRYPSPEVLCPLLLQILSSPHPAAAIQQEPAPEVQVATTISPREKIQAFVLPLSFSDGTSDLLTCRSQQVSHSGGTESCSSKQALLERKPVLCGKASKLAPTSRSYSRG